MALDQSLKWLAVTIHLESPLLITARQVGFVWESETFIPGGVLRGAVAEVAARHGQDLKLLFDRPNAPRFGHAYAGLEPAVGILPHTARTCKRYRGFRRDDQDEDRHGVWDTLLLQVFGQVKVEARCPTCDRGTVSYGGEPYVSVGSSGAWRYASPRVIMRRIGRTAVARERAAVADRLLYALEVIGEQIERDELDAHGRPLEAAAQFHSRVWADSSDGWPWDDWLREVTHLGGVRSRGLGRVRIEVGEGSARTPMDGEVVRAGMQLAQLTEDRRVADLGSPPGEMNVLDRILAFNRAAYAVKCLGKEWRNYWYFTLNMQSDAVLGDARGPRHCPRPADLEMPASVEWVWSGAGYSQAGGWSAAWGLPKRVTPSVTAGSTFVYRVPHGDEDLAQQVLKRCVALEQEGIGQRREEGLGWVQICTPFHLETEVQK